MKIIESIEREKARLEGLGGNKLGIEALDRIKAEIETQSLKSFVIKEINEEAKEQFEKAWCSSITGLPIE